MPKITDLLHASRNVCQISIELGTLGTSTTWAAFAANVLYSGCALKYDAYRCWIPVRIGIWPVIVKSLPSSALLVENFMKSQAVPRFLQEAYIAMFFASLNVGVESLVLPVDVGTGATPHLTVL